MGGGGSKVHSLKQDLRGKHFVVTGANTGIGYITARELAKMGAKVTMACKSEERGKAAMEKLRSEALEKPVKEGVSLQEGLGDVDLQLAIVDLGSLQSVIECAKRMRASGTMIDVLINNAGIMGIPERKETVDGFELQIGVNHFGHHLLTRLLEPLIGSGGRVIFVSSLGHDGAPGISTTTLEWDNINFEKPDSYDPWQSYGRSKLANVLDAKEFAKRLAGRGINTYALHPGAIKTELGRNMRLESSPIMLRFLVSVMNVAPSVFLTPLQGSQTSLKCAVDPDLGKPELSGKYWDNMKEKKPSALASDPENPPRYWAMTEEMIEAKLGKKIDDLIPSS